MLGQVQPEGGVKILQSMHIPGIQLLVTVYEWRLCGDISDRPNVRLSIEPISDQAVE